LIDTLLPGTAAGPRSNLGANGGGYSRPSSRNGGSFSSRRTKEGGIINTIIADERTNTLIVHANPKGADQVRELVGKLDKKLPAQVGGGKIHVVYLQFADAEEIGKTLNNLSQQAAPTHSNSPSPTGGVGVNPQDTTLFEGQIRVSPDKATNSIVITASPSDFVTVQRVINKLDIPRDQVYVEVVILEMTLGRQFDFSANIALPTSGIGSMPKGEDLLNTFTNPFSSNGVMLGLKGGSTQNVTINNVSVPVSSVMGLIRAIQTNSKANVLATPQILTLDNVEATFETSEKVPVESTSVNQGIVTSGITKEPISLTVTIKPQINPISNFVKMDINSKLADISDQPPPASLQGKAFITYERNAKTSVVVADGDTVVLGGLVRDKQSDTVSKVPLLGDIPLLGWLFRAKSTKTEKTNLLLFITPHIVRQYEKVRAILDKKLKERDEFLEGNAGGDDPMRTYRDNMIRSLPDMKDIKSYKPEKTAALNDDENPLEDAANPGLTKTNESPSQAKGAPNGSPSLGHSNAPVQQDNQVPAGPVAAPPLPVEAPPVESSNPPSAPAPVVMPPPAAPGTLESLPPASGGTP
jgi:general secretion pathway protein D